MTKRIRVGSIKRKKIDEDKLALAFLLLAKLLDEQSKADEPEPDDRAKPEAA